MNRTRKPKHPGTTREGFRDKDIIMREGAGFKTAPKQRARLAETGNFAGFRPPALVPDETEPVRRR